MILGENSLTYPSAVHVIDIDSLWRCASESLLTLCITAILLTLSVLVEWELSCKDEILFTFVIKRLWREKEHGANGHICHGHADKITFCTKWDIKNFPTGKIKGRSKIIYVKKNKTGMSTEQKWFLYLAIGHVDNFKELCQSSISWCATIASKTKARWKIRAIMLDGTKNTARNMQRWNEQWDNYQVKMSETILAEDSVTYYLIDSFNVFS